MIHSNERKGYLQKSPYLLLRLLRRHCGRRSTETGRREWEKASSSAQSAGDAAALGCGFVLVCSGRGRRWLFHSALDRQRHHDHAQHEKTSLYPARIERKGSDSSNADSARRRQFAVGRRKEEPKGKVGKLLFSPPPPRRRLFLLSPSHLINSHLSYPLLLPFILSPLLPISICNFFSRRPPPASLFHPPSLTHHG